MKRHTYEVRVDWTGNDGEGTKRYTGYRRDHTIVSSAKQVIQASSDPSFRGDPTRYNPEELLVASVSSCHMLWYLHLCSANKVAVVEYRDNASGELAENDDGSGAFVRVRLRPIVKIAPNGDRDKAMVLHREAHRFCFIANSVNFPIEIAPEVELG